MEDKENKLIATSIAAGTMCGILLTSATLLPKLKNYRPKTRPLQNIGDPNAQDPNDTYIEINGRKYIGTIDGQSIEDYLNRKRIN